MRDSGCVVQTLTLLIYTMAQGACAPSPPKVFINCFISCSLLYVSFQSVPPNHFLCLCFRCVRDNGYVVKYFNPVDSVAKPVLPYSNLERRWSGNETSLILTLAGNETRNETGRIKADSGIVQTQRWGRRGESEHSYCFASL